MNSYDIVEKTVGVYNAEAGKIGLTRHLASCHGPGDRVEKYRFQNRYKSIVCEEDAYFKELVKNYAGKKGLI